jgi:radical SAM protein (TIGR01212 family)
MNRNRYHSLNTFFRNTFGEKVFKLSLAGGFTCPVRDGSLSREGCVYCNPLSNLPAYCKPGMPLEEQMAAASGYVKERHGASTFIAYFQDYTATYADTAFLEKMYREALDFPGVRGLALCTRPDCLPVETLSLLENLSKETFLWVELGVQSGCDVTLLRMKRRHTVYDSEKALEELHRRGIRTAAHVILGFPGESREEALETAELVRKSGTAGVKLQNLHILRETPLAEDYGHGKVKLLKRSQYAALASDFLERIPPSTVVQRLSGEAPQRMLVAPSWAANKLAVMNRVKRELMYRDSWQGKLLGYSMEDIPGVTRN